MKDKIMTVLYRGLQAIGFVGVTIVAGSGGYHVIQYVLTNLGV